MTVDWEKIVKKYGSVVWRTAYRLLGEHSDASDCFQETFISAIEISRREKIRNFRALLTRLATTKALDRLRKNSRITLKKITVANITNEVAINTNPVEHLEASELAESLRTALSKLNQHEARVFSLRFLSDMSYRQISKQLGYKTSTTAVLLHRARKKLKSLLLEQPDNKGEVIL